MTCAVVHFYDDYENCNYQPEYLTLCTVPSLGCLIVYVAMWVALLMMVMMMWMMNTMYFYDDYENDTPYTPHLHWDPLLPVWLCGLP